MSKSVFVRLAVTAAAAAAAAFVSAGAAAATAPDGGARLEGPGFSSADAAVASYMDGLSAGDVDAMARAFAIETYVEHVDVHAQIARLRAYSPSFVPLLPGTGAFIAALNVQTRDGEVARQIRDQYLYLALDPLGVDPAAPEVLPDDAAVDEFVASLEQATGPELLASITTYAIVPLEIADPASYGVYVTDQSMQNIDDYRAILGADELTDVAVAFEVQGQAALATFSVARYGDAWWIERLGGHFAALANLSANHGTSLVE